MSILSAEKNLLLAVRNLLRSELVAQFPDAAAAAARIQVELDEEGVPTAAHEYLPIMPGEMRPGPTHNSSGGVFDFYYGVDVTVALRAANIPDDRKRDIFVGNLGGLANLLDRVIQVIDYRYDVINAANVLVAVDAPGTQGFIEPLKLTSMDARPSPTPPGFWGELPGRAAIAGIKRKLNFGLARRITYRTAT